MTTILGTPAELDLPAVLGLALPGVYPATVVDNQDPDGQGRVQVRLPWTPDPGGADRYEAWARLATTMAGSDRGTWFVPEVGDEVLVAFQAGDPRWPYVVGALWNGDDSPPESINSSNDIRSITSRAGITITFDDTDGAVSLRLETPMGQRVELADGGSTITVSDSSGNEVELAPGGITVTSSGPLSVSAPTATLDVGTLDVTAGISTFSGVVQVDTLISNAVVSSSYTPGVGNIW
jgi:uncharacterized protein involved in type VI secretion and phage assembly